MQNNIQDLQPNDEFKFNIRQRRWRVFNKAVTLGNDEVTPVEHRGKILVIYDGCKQKVMSPDDKVIGNQLYFNWIAKIKLEVIEDFRAAQDKYLY